MSTGALREWIKVMRVMRTPDGEGGYRERDVPLFETWARVATPRSLERAVAGKPADVRQYEVTYRDQGIDPGIGDKIFWNDSTLQIDGISPEPISGKVHLSCTYIE